MTIAFTSNKEKPSSYNALENRLKENADRMLKLDYTAGYKSTMPKVMNDSLEEICVNHRYNVTSFYKRVLTRNKAYESKNGAFPDKNERILIAYIICVQHRIVYASHRGV